jgi:hypothetical protein
MLGELAAVGSSVLGSAMSARSASKDRELQREALAHQKKMDTQGVRVRMADLKAAGINPILAGQYAAGSSAHVSPVGDAGAGAHVANAGSKVAEMMRAKKETEMLDSQVAVNDSQITKNNAEADEATARAGLTTATTAKTVATTTKDDVVSRLYSVPYLRNILAFGNEFFGGGAQVANSAANVSNAVTNSRRSKWVSGNAVRVRP